MRRKAVDPFCAVLFQTNILKIALNFPIPVLPFGRIYVKMMGSVREFARMELILFYYHERG